MHEGSVEGEGSKMYQSAEFSSCHLPDVSDGDTRPLTKIKVQKPKTAAQNAVEATWPLESGMASPRLSFHHSFLATYPFSWLLKRFRVHVDRSGLSAHVLETSMPSEA